jgi:hypothetical protein
MARGSKLLIVLALAGWMGCATAGVDTTTGPGCFDGKCDDASATGTQVDVDFDALNRQWPGPTVTDIRDAFRVRVSVGGRELPPMDSHLFGSAVNIIPYDDGDQARDATGAMIGRGDAVVSEYFPPGEIGIGLKHHRPEYRTLSLDGADPNAMKEHFKLQDTHIELVVGVEDRNGSRGVITLNNPQTYEDGRFGTADYPVIFLRPVYPDYLNAAQRGQFRDNIRTMMLGFNAVSNFPGDYNGGDPLAARTPELVMEHAAQMVRAIAGDEEARAWFRLPENMVYCAELAHISFSAGLLAPLNAQTFEPLVGEEVWAEFVKQLEAHNDGESSAFTTLNANPLARLVDATIAHRDLRPAPSYSPAGHEDRSRLAFTPMTMADIVESFMETHLDRRALGEDLAEVQAAALQGMKPGLLESMGMDALPETDPRRMAVDQLFAGIVGVVGTRHSSYLAFRDALEPYMVQARMMTGPRGPDSGEGLFVPPSLMHLIAQGRHPAGIMGLRYVGHGLHWSMLRSRTGGTQPTGPTMPTPTEPPAGSMVVLEESATLDEGGTARFEVTAPEGRTRLVVAMDNVTGDPDLYVRRSSAPSDSTYDCRPYLGDGESERCEVAPPGNDTFYIMVSGYTASSFRLRVTAE